MVDFPVGKYLFKVSSKDTRALYMEVVGLFLLLLLIGHAYVLLGKYVPAQS